MNSDEHLFALRLQHGCDWPEMFSRSVDKIQYMIDDLVYDDDYPERIEDLCFDPEDLKLYYTYHDDYGERHNITVGNELFNNDRKLLYERNQQARTAAYEAKLEKIRLEKLERERREKEEKLRKEKQKVEREKEQLRELAARYPEELVGLTTKTN